MNADAPLKAVAPGFRIRFPQEDGAPGQDEERFRLELQGRSRWLRIHDYAALYRVPGLYEALVYDKLGCNSPPRLARLFASVLADWPDRASDLRVLDFGAGNGVVAEELRKAGFRHFVGLDILPEARLAARRDRPSAYADYVVADLTSPAAEDLRRLEQHRLNCLVSVAALGFGDIPPEAFAAAFNLIAPDGWLGMTIKEDFLDPGDESGFGRLIRSMIDDGIIATQAHQRYSHRLSIRGEKIFYIALVARKSHAIPLPLIEEIDRVPAGRAQSELGQAAVLLGR